MKKKDYTLYAFYDWRGVGFLRDQRPDGTPDPIGVAAVQRWKAMGCPHVHDYDHAVALGIAK